MCQVFLNTVVVSFQAASASCFHYILASREAMVMKFSTENLFDMINPKMALETADHKHIKSYSGFSFIFTRQANMVDISMWSVTYEKSKFTSEFQTCSAYFLPKMMFCSFLVQS